MHKARVFTADVSILENQEYYQLAYMLASDERRKKTDRYYQAKDRMLSIGAELLLRYALQLSKVPSLDSIRIGEYGKPELADGEVHFNLSHSGDYVLCAVSDWETGCDIEKIEPIDLETGRKFHPDEYRQILSIKDHEGQQKMFYRYWTLKESYLKAIGTGMMRSLDTFCIRTENNLSVQDDTNGGTYYFQEFTDMPGYQIAVCIAGEMEQIHLEKVNLGSIIYSMRA